MSKHTVLLPRMSEKAYAVSETLNSFVFTVPMTANKHTVKSAIEVQYAVEVTSVRIMITKGKAKQTYRRGGRSVAGKQSDFKKAYVTIKAGQKIPIFAAIEEPAEAKTEKKPKAKNASTKLSTKETK